MDKLSKAREEICKDCMFGIAITNCQSCLYTTLKEKKEEKPELEYNEDDYDGYDPMLFDRMFTD